MGTRFATDAAPVTGAAPVTSAPSDSDVWEGEIGATLPLCNRSEGMTRWDPLGFTVGKNAAKFDQYRAAELKHGRVAMMATIGLVAQHYFRFKGLAFNDGAFDLSGVPSGVGAISAFPSSAAFGVLVLVAGIFELRMSDKDGKTPGDFGDPLNWRKEVAGTIQDEKMLKTYELEHGRLAMLGVMGTLAAEYVTGYDAVDQWGHAAEGAGRLIRYTTMM